MPDQTFTALAGSNGVATITVRPTYPQTWVVSQVSTECPAAPATATSEIRRNGSLITPMRAISDVASGEPPVELQPADHMAVTWNGLTPNTIAKAVVIYAVAP